MKKVDRLQTKQIAAQEAEIAALGPWFHNLHLPAGVQTAPDHALGDFPAFKWRQLAPHLPAKLAGWHVLDIGCNAGYYTFELAKRGGQVVGIDVDPHYLRQATWAAEQLGLASQVTFRQMQVYDLAHETEAYDLVLFMGVFYHLRYPTLGLDIVTQKVKRLLVFQSLTLPGEEVYGQTSGWSLDDRAVLQEPGWPKMAFFEHDFAHDHTNWWAPNHACVEALLRSSGMQILTRPGHEIYLCEPAAVHPARAVAERQKEYRAATGQT